MQGSRTSAAAAAAIEPHAQTRKSQVLSAILLAGAGGLTDEEIAAETGLVPNTARPRRVELEREGAIVDSGRTRRTAQGSEAVVWVAAPARAVKADPYTAARGMSPTAHEAWVVVEMAAGPVSTRDVAAVVGVTVSAVGLILEWLAHRGLIRRGSAPGTWCAQEFPSARVLPSAPTAGAEAPSSAPPTAGPRTRENFSPPGDAMAALPDWLK